MKKREDAEFILQAPTVTLRTRDGGVAYHQRARFIVGYRELCRAVPLIPPQAGDQ